MDGRRPDDGLGDVTSGRARRSGEAGEALKVAAAAGVGAFLATRLVRGGVVGGVAGACAGVLIRRQLNRKGAALLAPAPGGEVAPVRSAPEIPPAPVSPDEIWEREAAEFEAREAARGRREKVRIDAVEMPPLELREVVSAVGEAEAPDDRLAWLAAALVGLVAGGGLAAVAVDGFGDRPVGGQGSTPPEVIEEEPEPAVSSDQPSSSR